ncbi:MAG: hypothetical protein GKR94_30415 [Gammaproteobacteria bacterium]|nr:hypothetical protein [Gammaproteobacteria bacterium]
MKLDDLTIRLRPRTAWAAGDLGLTMMQHWWRPAYGVWFASTLPIFALAHAIAGWTLWALLIFWWLKPVYERVLLFVYSRAAFGSVPTVWNTLRQTPRLLWRTGLLWHLSLGRLFSWTRAYLLPAYQLEGQTGTERRARLRVLAARDSGTAILQFLIYSALEFILASSSFVLLILLLPESVDMTGYGFDTYPNATQFGLNVLVYIGISVVQPAFVASGFALYLNRRTVLEGWDLELDLRRLAERLSALRPDAGALIVALLVCAALPMDRLRQRRQGAIGCLQSRR